MSSNVVWEILHSLRPSSAQGIGRVTHRTETSPTRTIQTVYPTGYQSSSSVQPQKQKEQSDE
jgi:hypothetical protein